MLNGKFSDEEFALLKQVTTLVQLRLRGMSITDDGLAALEQMPQLTLLSLSAEAITDAGLIHLRHLPNLRSLRFERTNIQGAGLKHLPHPDRITALDFQDSPINDAGLQGLGAFTNLETLGLWGTKVTDGALDHLSACPHLKRLDLWQTAITNDGVKKLLFFAGLEHVVLCETQASDDCLDDLLQMPALKSVHFGEGQISVSTFERLEKAEVKVEHGRLLNVVRDENLLRYTEMDFEVDTQASSLKAYMRIGVKGVTWLIEVNCTNKYVPDHMQPAHLEGPPIESFKSWAELEGEEFRIRFDDEELHPIMPGNPGNIYVGWHAAPNDHVITFKQRTGNRMLVDWRCIAKDSKPDEGQPVWVNAEIPFTELMVWSDKALSIDDAKRHAESLFDLAVFDDSRIETSGDKTRVTFHVRP